MRSTESMARALIKLPYPRPIPSSGGGWERRWHLANKRPLPWRITADDLAGRLSSEGHTVILSPSGPYELLVTEKFVDSPWSDDDFLFSAWRLVGRIDRELGPLRTIEGVPRNRWAPFRAFETGHLVKNPRQLSTTELLDVIVRAHSRRNSGAVLVDGDGKLLGSYIDINFGELRDIHLFDDEKSYSEWKTSRKDDVHGVIRLLADNDEVRLLGDDQLNPGLSSLLHEVEDPPGFFSARPAVA